MSDTNKRKMALVCGGGPGLGMVIAKALAGDGYYVVCLNRSHITIPCEGVEVIQQDCSDVEATQTLLSELILKHGAPAVFIHNPSHLLIKPLAATSPAEFEEVWRAMVLSAFTIVQSVVPAMAQQGGGAVVVSGATASIRGGARFSAFASAKFALRGLVQSVAREYQSQGIHAAHVLLDGIIDSSKSRELHSLESERMMSPESIAAAYLTLIKQDSSAWTHELDLRPSSEQF